MRIEFAGALYHVTSRRNSRQNVYLNDADRCRWLSVFAEVCDRFNWVCYSYCLMDNHYHLFIETPEGNLSQDMQRKISGDTNLDEVPRPQKRQNPKPLQTYKNMTDCRDEAIIAAYRSGGYSIKEIAAHFDLHYSSVSKIIKLADDS